MELSYDLLKATCEVYCNQKCLCITHNNAVSVSWSVSFVSKALPLNAIQYCLYQCLSASSLFYFYFKFSFISDFVSKVSLLISILVLFLEVSLLVLLFYCLARIH